MVVPNKCILCIRNERRKEKRDKIGGYNDSSYTYGKKETGSDRPAAITPLGLCSGKYINQLCKLMKLLQYITITLFALASVFFGCHQSPSAKQVLMDSMKARGWPDSSIVFVDDTPRIVIPYTETDAPKLQPTDSSIPIVTSKWVSRNPIKWKRVEYKSPMSTIGCVIAKDTPNNSVGVGYVISESHVNSYLYRTLKDTPRIGLVLDSPRHWTFIIQTGDRILLRMEDTNYNKITVIDTMGSLKLLIRAAVEHTLKGYN